MSNTILNKNLACLKETDPALYEKIAPIKGSSFYQAVNSKSGLPTLIRVDRQGNKKQILSNYDPVAEADRYLKTLNIQEHSNFIITGLGLGYQATQLIKNTSSLSKIFIFEKDPELFALALRKVDLSLILKHPRIKLFIDANPLSLGSLLEPEQTNFTLNKYCIIKQVSIIGERLDYYGVLLKEIDLYFEESEINFKTLSAHSKLYYKNIFSNLNSSLNSPGIDSLKDCLLNFSAIICSAGPSLNKNIQLLKAARERFFLIAVATALKPLLHNGIQPDIVISIDPDEQTIKSFNFTNNIEDLWLVYSPSVPGIIPKAFPKRRLVFDSELYLADWFRKYTEEKGSLGKTSSVAHSAVKLAQFFGCSPVILVGQDLSFCQQRQHCLYSFYHEEHIDKLTKLKPLAYWDHLKYSNFGPNLTQCLDIFGKRISSTLAMKSYSHIFSKIFDDSRLVINATEGGIPIKGAQNLTLREALYKYCDTLIGEKKQLFLPSHAFDKNNCNSLKTSLARQINILSDIAEKLSNLKLNYLKTLPPSIKDKQLFLKEMNTIYECILKSEETALLLQGYDFAGFSNWYHSNNQIMKNMELLKVTSLVDEEFDRDLKFFEVLVESVEYLIVNFKKSMLH
jgi:hypothetical protein